MKHSGECIICCIQSVALNAECHGDVLQFNINQPWKRIKLNVIFIEFSATVWNLCAMTSHATLFALIV